MDFDVPPPEAFHARLSWLIKASGSSLRTLELRTKVRRSTISGWQTGRALPQLFDDLWAVVGACADRASASGRPLPPKLRDKADWHNRLISAQKIRDAVTYQHGPESTRVASPKPQAPDDHPIADGATRPVHRDRPGPLTYVRELTDPFALDVHRAIDVAGASTSEPLPSYIRREHDELMQKSVEQALNEGRSQLVVLVGDSSTGKTRACWELIHQPALAEWRLWHPDPTRLEHVTSAMEAVQPRTVLWLNNIDEYLLDPPQRLREEMAEALRRLISDARRGPVLVLGTIWPSRLATITSSPERGHQQDGNQDPYKRARTLLVGNTMKVPPVFDDQAWGKLLRAAAFDRRLREAQHRARERRVAQFLAGVPWLQERYDNAPPEARALIDAAMDARILGHGRLLPRKLLECAAPGYLTDGEWHGMDPERWSDHGLSYAADSRHGTRGLLSPHRPREAGPGKEDHLELADYLDQTARRNRRVSAIPSTLWQALQLHAPPVELATLADQTQRAGFYQNAIGLYEAAVERGDTSALLSLTWLLKRAGRTEEALRTCRRAIAVNDSGWETLGELLRESGDDEGAITAYERAVDAGSIYALGQLTYMLTREGRVQEALDSLQGHAANHSNEQLRASAARFAGELLEESGRTDEAISLYMQSSNGEFGERASVGAAAAALERSGRASELLSFYKGVAESGNYEAIRQAANLFDVEGRTDEGIVWLQSMPPGFAFGDAEEEAARLLEKTAGLKAALDWLATRDNPWAAFSLMRKLGRAEEAPAWVESYAEQRGKVDKELLATCLEEAGRTQEALYVYQESASTGSVYALLAAARILEADGLIEEAILWLTDLAEMAANNSEWAWCTAGEVLGRADRIDEALEYFLRASANGSYGALSKGAILLMDSSDLDCAMAWLRARADEGFPDTLSAAERLLWHANEYEEAERLMRTGWDGEPFGRR